MPWIWSLKLATFRFAVDRANNVKDVSLDESTPNALDLSLFDRPPSPVVSTRRSVQQQSLEASTTPPERGPSSPSCVGDPTENKQPTSTPSSQQTVQEPSSSPVVSTKAARTKRPPRYKAAVVEPTVTRSRAKKVVQKVDVDSEGSSANINPNLTGNRPSDDTVVPQESIVEHDDDDDVTPASPVPKKRRSAKRSLARKRKSVAR
jgi:hypothetical protein